MGIVFPINKEVVPRPAACSFGWWLVLIVLKEKYSWLVAGGWFILREKY
jgi:hypothetical protein